jgi:hypothetical protein
MKTETKHTPGPWIFEDNGTNDFGVTVHSIDQHEDAPTLEDKNHEVNMAEVFGSEANARLIAASPELLELLDKALAITETIRFNAECRELEEEAYELINKIKGS